MSKCPTCGGTGRIEYSATLHEAPETYDWIAQLADTVGGPPIETVKADFTDRIAAKREIVKTKWVREGVDQTIIDAALSILHPTGIPFLDLCIWKGRFPSAKARFCTEFLKSRPLDEQVTQPALDIGPVVRWQGERREESLKRRGLPFFQRVCHPQRSTMLIFRPILDWSVDQVFAIVFRALWKTNVGFVTSANGVQRLLMAFSHGRGWSPNHRKEGRQHSLAPARHRARGKVKRHSLMLRKFSIGR